MPVHRSLLFLPAVGLLIAALVEAQTKEVSSPRKSPITTHVLDTASGAPGAGIPIALERQIQGQWKILGRGETDRQGRLDSLHPQTALEAGIYRLIFDTGAYFQARGQKTFFPRVEVTFQIEKTDEHYHVPLLLSPFGFSTYRGS